MRLQHLEVPGIEELNSYSELQFDRRCGDGDAHCLRLRVLLGTLLALGPFAGFVLLAAGFVVGACASPLATV